LLFPSLVKWRGYLFYRYINNSVMKIELEALSILRKVDRFLSERRIKAYLVGGLVRDMFLGRSTADIDVAIAADALEIAREIADTLEGKFVPLDEANRIARVVFYHTVLPQKKQWYVDFSTLIGDIDQELARRDFTINAMAVDLSCFVVDTHSFEIIDPFNGQRDLERKVLKAIDETVFEDDPARLLRAVRLQAELGLTVSKETEALVRRFSPLISCVAGERVREELLRILVMPGAGRIVRYLDNLGLLTAIIPELEPSRGVEQPKEHHWDVFNHSLETVKAVDFLLRQGSWEYASSKVLEEIGWSEKLNQHFRTEIGAGGTRASLLRLAALLHDVAKPETKIIADKRTRFFGHTEQGAEAAVKILERLRFSNKEIKLVEIMVRYHLRPTQMSQKGLPTPRAVYRYLRDTGPAAIDILFLSLADHLAARGPDLDLTEWKWHAGQVNCILFECNRQESIIKPTKLIDGHDLINLFSLKPGPKVGEILEAVREAQAEGRITNRDEALYYVKNRLL
jgi:poly(A) polymerase